MFIVEILVARSDEVVRGVSLFFKLPRGVMMLLNVLILVIHLFLSTFQIQTIRHVKILSRLTPLSPRVYMYCFSAQIIQ